MTPRLAFSYAVGIALVLAGAYAFFSTGDLAQWTSAVKWFAGGVVLHDFVLTPVVLVVGAVLVRVVPGPYRGFAQAALYISGAVTLTSVILVLGYGRDPRVPSQQPLDYGRNLIVVIVLIWVGCALLAVLRHRRRSAHSVDDMDRADAGDARRTTGRR